MSLAVVFSRALVGLAAPRVIVEVHVSGGLPGFYLVGLAETEVREARERVRAAIQSAGFDFPARKITVNLAPADLPKESGRYDLAIALGVLVATGQTHGRDLARHEFAGELGLSGDLRAIRGALAMVLAARDDGRAFVLPADSAREAALAADAIVHPARTLGEVCGHLDGRALLPCATPGPRAAVQAFPDLVDVRGQAQAKRALVVAAAGEHSLLMVGPPGTGKSMLAHRLPGLLPPLDEAEALESAALASLAAPFDPGRFGARPFRAPHHSASAAAIVGGGSPPQPGEISLAHHGVLFMDELPEWNRRVLEVLREPMESGAVAISRAARRAVFPAAFQFIAAMNPCPCGYRGDPSGRCSCTPDIVERYRARLSGPLVDRIDLVVEVSTPAAADIDLTHGEPVPETPALREAVAAARSMALARQGVSNARLDVSGVARHCMPDAAARDVLVRAAERLGLSARGYHRIAKVARSCADLAHAPSVGREHVSEALGLRRNLSRHRRAG